MSKEKREEVEVEPAICYEIVDDEDYDEDSKEEYESDIDNLCQECWDPDCLGCD